MNLGKPDVNKVYSVGNIGNGKSRYKGKHTKEYNTWISMLQRCYDYKLHLRNPTYIDCFVCEEWLDFEIFSKWFKDNYIEGYQLDKDLLVKGNKIYSPETCCFVPKEINLLIIQPQLKKELPHGVQKFRDKFRAFTRTNNIQNHIGCYNTIEEASEAYKLKKKNHITIMAEKYKEIINNKVYQALLNYTINN